MKTKKMMILLLVVTLCSSASGQSLNSLLQKAYAENPALKALQFEYEAALQKGPQVSQLPDPTVGLGVPILRPETRLGGQALIISVQQMFPWFGTLKAKEEVFITMAKSKVERIQAERLNIDYQIKSAYFNLYLLEATQGVIRKNVRIFETLEKVALAKVESGKSIASDVLNVRLKIEELNQQIQILEEQKNSYSATINEALNNPQNIPISMDTAELKLADLAYNLNQYRENIQANHPLVKMIDWNIEASNKELELNALSGKPTFGIGIDYSIVKKRSDAIPVRNGRDILIPKLMVSLPIYRKKYAAKKEEEKFKQQAYELQKEQLTNSLIRKIQQNKADYESARLMYELAQKQIKISESAFNILLSAYSSKGQRFDELMKLQNNMNSYEIEILKAVVKSHLSKFKIEQLTDY